MIPDSSRDQLGLVIRRETRQAEEQHACCDAAEAKHQLTEVLVDGHEDALTPIGPVEHLVVGDSGSEFRDVIDVVAIEPKPLYDSSLYTLVSEELHATDLGVGYATSARNTSAPNRTAANTPSRVSRG